jgi:LAO/AO transport system kinase
MADSQEQTDSNSSAGDSHKSSLSVNKGVDQPSSINPKRLRNISSRRQKLSVDDYVEGITRGDRTVLSRAITLVESSKPEHQEIAQQILNACVSQAGDSIRIGITGVPGVGKSTFIEAMGNHILEQDRSLAVLAIDPSSSRSKGSILGDKTRMGTLANHERAFVRPSPTGGSLGGVARKTRETILLCEAAGYDTIFIETVGVGQSETAVHSMVDFFLLLMLAGAGDELQGIKRGIMEMADVIAINKADSGNERAAQRAAVEYQNALHLFPAHKSEWTPQVTTCSALKEKGMDKIWSLVEEYLDLTKQNGYFYNRRRDQARHWMHETIEQRLKDNFYHHQGVQEQLESLEQQVQEGMLSSFAAAEKLLRIFRGQ